MYAHYYATPRQKQLIITTDCTLQTIVKTIDVTGKKEARQVAAAHNAQPWNF